LIQVQHLYDVYKTVCKLIAFVIIIGALLSLLLVCTMKVNQSSIYL